jgi:hypothetical protein
MPVTKIGSSWRTPGYEGMLNFYRKDTGASIFTVTESGPIFPNPSGGMDYYVDGNTVNTVQDGISWATAFDTLAEALAASHARIGTAAYRSWAVRNRIFVVGDALTEDLTKLAQKTDVIGLGQCDGFGPGARILGNHVIDSTDYMGCRLINLAFKDNDATGTILTIPTAQSGIQIINCDILTGTATVTGILMTASTDFRVQGCRFFSSWTSSFSTAAISIATGSSNRCIIEDNTIGNTHATGVGILVNAGRTGGNSYIRRNDISTTGITINEASSTFFVIDNRMVSGGAFGATSHVVAAAKSAGNIVTGSDKTGTVPFATIA